MRLIVAPPRRPSFCFRNGSLCLCDGDGCVSIRRHAEPVHDTSQRCQHFVKNFLLAFGLIRFEITDAGRQALQ